MNIYLKRISSYILSALILLLAYKYLQRHAHEFMGLENIRLHKVFYLVLFIISDILINGYSQKIIIEIFGVKLRANEWIGLSVINTTGNMLLPFKAGAGLRAVYLKKKHSLPFSAFAGVLGATYAVRLFIYSLFGATSVLYANSGMDQRTFWALISIFTFFILFTLSLPLTIKIIPHIKEGRLHFINSIVGNFKSICADKGLISRIILFSVLFFINSAMIIYFSFNVFNIELSFLPTVTINALNSLSLYLPILSGTFGISETIIVLVAGAFGISITNGILAAAVRRLSIFLVIFPLSVIYTFILRPAKNTDK